MKGGLPLNWACPSSLIIYLVILFLRSCMSKATSLFRTPILLSSRSQIRSERRLITTTLLPDTRSGTPFVIPILLFPVGWRRKTSCLLLEAGLRRIWLESDSLPCRLEQSCEEDGPSFSCPFWRTFSYIYLASIRSHSPSSCADRFVTAFPLAWLNILNILCDVCWEDIRMNKIYVKISSHKNPRSCFRFRIKSTTTNPKEMNTLSFVAVKQFADRVQIHPSYSKYNVSKRKNQPERWSIPGGKAKIARKSEFHSRQKMHGHFFLI